MVIVSHVVVIDYTFHFVADFRCDGVGKLAGKVELVETPVSYNR